MGATAGQETKSHPNQHKQHGALLPVFSKDSVLCNPRLLQGVPLFWGLHLGSHPTRGAYLSVGMTTSIVSC